jgi:tetratricopeptide (TPR) repeat protein
VRSGGELRREAVVVLQELRKRYRSVLAIGHELVFALQEEGRNAEAVAELDALDRQFVEVDEETLCRRGRCAKDAADVALKAKDLVQAEELYRRALACYAAAYTLPGTHYSGINKATVLLLLAGVVQARDRPEEGCGLAEQARLQADDLLAWHARWPRKYDDDNIWHAATLGEVYLLRREWQEAERAYRRALAEPNVKPFHRETTGRQARRIIEAWRRLHGESDAAEFPLDTLFAPPAAGNASAGDRSKGSGKKGSRRRGATSPTRVATQARTSRSR